MMFDNPQREEKTLIHNGFTENQTHAEQRVPNSILIHKVKIQKVTYPKIYLFQEYPCWLVFFKIFTKNLKFPYLSYFPVFMGLHHLLS